MAATTEPSKEDGADEQVHEDVGSSHPVARNEGSFFAIYKRGQGYWTRMGTAIGVAALLGFTLLFLYRDLLPYLGVAAVSTKLITAGVITLAGILLAWWLMNAPKRAQFLIDTDSELKKVNWASRAELVTSTKVVILFMVLIAIALFVFDQQFHGLFYVLAYKHAGLSLATGKEQVIHVYSVRPEFALLKVSGILFTSVLTFVGYLIWHGTDEDRPKFWGMVMLIVGAIGLLGWIGFTIFSIVGGGATGAPIAGT
ncbi:MAG: preprotein translocase subunit SecE [Tepidisphaeraceae bacterium]